MIAVPPPTLGDLYSPERPIPAIVRETERSGWPHDLTPPELLQLGRVMARVVFPHSPHRTGSCTSGAAVYCTAARPRGLTVRIRMTGCKVGSDDEAPDGRACAIWEDGSARGVIVAVLAPAARWPA